MEQPSSADSPLAAKKGKAEKDKKEKEKDKKDKKGEDKAGKGQKEPPKVPPDGSGGLGGGRLLLAPALPVHPPGLSPQTQQGSKKQKELPKELHQAPPVVRVLGSSPVVLEPLLAGEPLVSTVCNFGVIRTLEADRLTLNRV